jgi:hypothetical protein
MLSRDMLTGRTYTLEGKGSQLSEVEIDRRMRSSEGELFGPKLR